MANVATERNCSITGRPFSIGAREAQLVADFGLPLPTKAPMERWIYAVGQSTPFAFRRTTCPATNTPILTRWSESGAIRGVSSDWFWSDECDNSIAGRTYDFQRPFFEQFEALARACFAPSINRINCENSPYVNASFQLKDCHLCFACENLRDCFYSALCSNSTDLVFCSGISNSELCYHCLDCDGIYGSRFLQDCRNCRDCLWCIDCIGCSNCFQCFGLRQASDGFYIRNKKVTAEEWEREIGAHDLGSHATEKRLVAEATQLFADKRSYDTCFQNEDSTALYHVTHCKNCVGTLYSQNCEDCKDIIFTVNARDCYSVVWGRRAERCYQVIGVNEAYDCSFCDGAIGGARNQMYSFCCYNGCHDVFGCFFLKNKSFCILNKQYSESEYKELLPRIKKHMQSTGELGEWFPSSFYATPYTESWARYFLADLSEEQIQRRGLIVSTEPKYSGGQNIALPDNIDDFSEDLCATELVCETTGQRYNIGSQELRALQKQRCPIPRQRWSAVLTQMQSISIERCHRELLDAVVIPRS